MPPWALRASALPRGVPRARAAAPAHRGGAARRSEAMEPLGDEAFAEYYHPLRGAPLGSLNQSWTAAVALDWLLDEE